MCLVETAISLEARGASGAARPQLTDRGRGRDPSGWRQLPVSLIQRPLWVTDLAGISRFFPSALGMTDAPAITRARLDPRGSQEDFHLLTGGWSVLDSAELTARLRSVVGSAPAYLGPQLSCSRCEF